MYRLLIEVGILSNCKYIDKCRPCRHLLTFALDVLQQKWDEIRFINFEKALELIKKLKHLFQYSAVLKHYEQNRRKLKRIIAKARIENNHLELIIEHQSFFLEAIGKDAYIKNFIYGLVKTNSDICQVNQFKDYLMI